MSKVDKTLSTVADVSETVSMAYKDIAQPAAQEVGKGLHTLSKTIHIALSPVSALVWGYEKISNYVQTSLEEKLKDVPKEDIQTPDPSIAGPAVEALRYSGHKEELREMFSNLLATAMDKTTASKAHPSFVEVIRQINHDEAKIIAALDGKSPIPVIKIRLYGEPDHHFAEPLTNFSNLPYQANCSHPDLGPSYLENIERLGLAHITYDMYNTNPNAYDLTENHPVINEWKEKAVKLGKRFEISRGVLNRTAFGEKFYNSCVISK